MGAVCMYVRNVSLCGRLEEKSRLIMCTQSSVDGVLWARDGVDSQWLLLVCLHPSLAVSLLAKGAWFQLLVTLLQRLIWSINLCLCCVCCPQYVLCPVWSTS